MNLNAILSAIFLVCALIGIFAYYTLYRLIDALVIFLTAVTP